MLVAMHLKIIHQQKLNKIKFQFIQMALKMMDYMDIQTKQDVSNQQLLFLQEEQ